MHVINMFRRCGHLCWARCVMSTHHSVLPTPPGSPQPSPAPHPHHCVLPTPPGSLTHPSPLPPTPHHTPQGSKATPVLTMEDLRPGLTLVGWVGQITPEALWLEVAPGIRGRVQRLDTADSAAALKAYPAGFSLGQPVKATVLGVDREHHTLDLTMREAAAAGGHPSPGQLVTGAVVTARGEGVLVQLGGKAQGIVALTDLHDTWVPNALTAVKPGTLVTARVLDPAARASSSSSSKGPQRLQLSLRGSEGGSIEGYTPPAAAAAAGGQQKAKTAAAAAEAAPKGLLTKDQLKVGSTVKGYVRAVSAKGLFIQLDRTHMARVKLSQMSDGFVEDPAATFPPGTLVEGKIVAVTPATPSPGDTGDTKAGDAKLEVSLRTAPGGGWRQLEDIKEGELTTGKVGQRPGQQDRMWLTPVLHSSAGCMTASWYRCGICVTQHNLARLATPHTFNPRILNPAVWLLQLS